MIEIALDQAPEMFQQAVFRYIKNNPGAQLLAVTRKETFTRTENALITTFTAYFGCGPVLSTLTTDVVDGQCSDIEENSMTTAQIEVLIKKSGWFDHLFSV